MTLVQCMSCNEKIIEKEGKAILWCPFCGGSHIKVLEDEEEGD